ncbi:phage baseplate assembly protein V [Variovorax sp. GB1P17]|uniref:phage baseplate assembly protein V n=1 Tax=Variovorax sp. GB1P17 TaxID=3443740 RepID=UPI003F4794B9
MKALLNSMAVAAQRAGDDVQKTRMGIVDAYDPNTFSVKVKLQPSGVLSGWIPIASCYVGNGWGLFAAPTVGDSVRIDAQEGDIDAGTMGASFFNDVDRPLPVPSGEFWLQHKTGSFLKFLNNGDVSVHTARDLIADVGRNVQATVAGDANIAVTGTITSSATQWNHTGPVFINGTLNVKYQIVGTGGLGITTPFGNVGGYAAQITGNVNALNGALIGNAWGINLTGADVSADGITLKLHRTTGVQTGGGISGAPTI